MLNNILNKLQYTSQQKLNLYQNTARVFEQLWECCRSIEETLSAQLPTEGSVTLILQKINEHEFHFRFGADVLVFILQSNIVRLPDDAYLSKSKYLKSDKSLRYFGQVLVYNFMSDTLTYGRLDDPGYLIGRLLLNKENKFFIEGDRRIVFEFPELKDNLATGEKLNHFVTCLMESALENDLLAPEFQDIMIITYEQKLEHTSAMGSPQKIGFDFFAKNRA
jgi:hypothetical protein